MNDTTQTGSSSNSGMTTVHNNGNSWITITGIAIKNKNDSERGHPEQFQPQPQMSTRNINGSNNNDGESAHITSPVVSPWKYSLFSSLTHCGTYLLSCFCPCHVYSQNRATLLADNNNVLLDLCQYTFEVCQRNMQINCYCFILINGLVMTFYIRHWLSRSS